MELTFNQSGGTWVAKHKAGPDFNIYIEIALDATVELFMIDHGQINIGHLFKYFSDKKVIDVDIMGYAHVDSIIVICSSKPFKATIESM